MYTKRSYTDTYRRSFHLLVPFFVLRLLDKKPENKKKLTKARDKRKDIIQNKNLHMANWTMKYTKCFFFWIYIIDANNQQPANNQEASYRQEDSWKQKKYIENNNRRKNSQLLTIASPLIIFRIKIFFSFRLPFSSIHT